MLNNDFIYIYNNSFNDILQFANYLFTHIYILICAKRIIFNGGFTY